jgi:hypothetical protein
METIMSKLDVVVFQRERWWVAQALQFYIGAQAFSVDDVLYELQRSIAGHVAICVENKLKPFENLGPAPQSYWDKFNSAVNELTPKFASFSSPTLTPVQEFRLAA